jgi:hypothetical protein
LKSRAKKIAAIIIHTVKGRRGTLAWPMPISRVAPRPKIPGIVVVDVKYAWKPIEPAVRVSGDSMRSIVQIVEIVIAVGTIHISCPRHARNCGDSQDETEI